jgi:multidrug transporter EmrE-like cation transporter
MNRYIPLILAGVLLNAMAQLCLKQGTRVMGHFDFTLNNLIPVGMKAALNLYVLLGMTCYAVSIVLWIMVLSRVDVSYAYPFLSVVYIVTAVAGRWFFV